MSLFFGAIQPLCRYRGLESKLNELVLEQELKICWEPKPESKPYRNIKIIKEWLQSQKKKKEKCSKCIVLNAHCKYTYLPAVSIPINSLYIVSYILCKCYLNYIYLLWIFDIFIQPEPLISRTEVITFVC